MRLVFAGTPEFAASHLRALIAECPALGYELVGVFTQPDRASGRGLQLTPSPVRALAQLHQIPVFTPNSLRSDRPGGPEGQRQLAALAPDLMLVVAYGLLLPKEVLSLPRLGCINVHASLLPRWRGAAPIQRAIEAGDTLTGVSLMQMEAGLDTGPVWSVHPLAIEPTDTAGLLHDTLAALGAQALVDLLRRQPFERETPAPQREDGACYAAKITAQDRRIPLGLDAVTVFNRIRSLDPSPGASLVFRGQPVKVGGAALVDPSGRWAEPGRIVSVPSASQSGLVVACGQGLLGLGWLQRAGGKRLGAAEFVRGVGISVNDAFLLEGGSDADV